MRIGELVLQCTFQVGGVPMSSVGWLAGCGLSWTLCFLLACRFSVGVDPSLLLDCRLWGRCCLNVFCWLAISRCSVGLWAVGWRGPLVFCWLLIGCRPAWTPYLLLAGLQALGRHVPRVFCWLAGSGSVLSLRLLLACDLWVFRWLVGSGPAWISCLL